MLNRLQLLQRIINPHHGDLAPDLAKYILTLDFSPEDHAQYAELEQKAQAGSLSVQERALLDDFLEVNDFLAIVQAKARASLKRSSAA